MANYYICCKSCKLATKIAIDTTVVSKSYSCINCKRLANS